jgi:PAS domain S-box-containing protein
MGNDVPPRETKVAPNSSTRRVANARLHGRDAAAEAARILVVDDDAASRLLLEDLLAGAGFVVSTAPDADRALVEARRMAPDLVLTDLQMPRVGGVELCRRLQELDRDLSVVVMTAHSGMQSAIDSLRAGAEDYLIKPLDLDAVLWCVERTLARRADRLAHDQLYRELNERLVLSNIREQEHAETEARQRAQLNMLLENLDEGVIIGDGDGQILLRNRAAHDIVGLMTAEPPAIAANSLEAFDPDGRPVSVEERPLARATRGEQFTDYELMYVLSSGERRRVVFTGANVRGETGNVAMTIVVFRDVTEVRRLEQRRREYLALISHDLRNPLSTILMSVSRLKTLMAKDGARSGVSDVERAERNVKRMTEMLESFTEAASLEAHGVEFQRLPCDLSDVVTDVVDGMDDALARRVTVVPETTPPFRVLADPSRLGRVVVNLLTNALKYSPGDSPVDLRLATDGNAVRLDVVDGGIGIAPEEIELIFDRYYRTAAGKSSAGGSGLGLYIARLIVEAHGGHIEVSSEVGKGSRFRLVLPAQQ